MIGLHPLTRSSRLIPLSDHKDSRSTDEYHVLDHGMVIFMSLVNITELLFYRRCQRSMSDPYDAF